MCRSVNIRFFNKYNLVGFLFGFLTAFSLLIINSQFASIMNHTHKVFISKNPTTNNNDESLAEILKRDVRILCIVLTCPEYHETRAIHIKATWGKRCTKLVFSSSENDDELGAVALIEAEQSGYHDLWNKTRESFRYIYEKYYDQYDWFLKADDDTYIIMENLRYMLAAYVPSTPIYFGHKMIRFEKEYMSGGASYMLSKEALHRFMTTAFANTSICPPAHRFAAEDLYMGICLHSVNVILADSRFALEFDNKPKFFPLELSAFMEPNWNSTLSDWLFEMTPHKIVTGLDCCSNFSIAFHYVQPQQMYAYEFFIYHLQKFGMKSPARNLPRRISHQEAVQLFKSNTTI